MATIASIAESLGVSVPTVSKVLNGRPDVAPATRNRVEAALKAANYQRRGSGRSTSSVVELVMHTIESPWALEVIQGVQTAAEAEDLSVVLTGLSGSHQPGSGWVDGVLERKPVGVILVLTEIDVEQQRRLQSRNIPFVLVDTYGEVGPTMPTVGSNNWHGGLVATQHLLDLGHERIGIISGPQEYLCSRARVSGYRSAHEAAGLEWDPALLRWGDFALDGGYRYGMELLSRPDRPTAIFAGSDYQALGVLRAARELNLSVPDDLSLVGYDNVPLASWISPTLTTVNQPLKEMAATATRMVLDQSSLPSRIELSTALVQGESTAPLG